MDAEGIAPCSLTADLAERLARKVEASANGAIKFPTLARQFAQHLIDLGVASPPPVTEAQAIRATLLGDYETYLIKQRGLSQRSIYHVLRFAHRFLD